MSERDDEMADLRRRLALQTEYGIWLQRAIECHCRGKEIPPAIGDHCRHLADMLNRYLEEVSNGTS